jgi:hypothetical protein
MMLDVPYQRFFVRSGQSVLCQPALVLALFTPRLQGDERLSGPLSAFVRRFGDQLEWYQDDPQMTGSKKMPRANRDDFLAELQRQCEGAGFRDWSLELRGMSQRTDWTPPVFEFHKCAAPHAEMSLWMALPLPWLEAEGAHGVELLLQEIAQSEYPFLSGYVGLGIVCNHRAAIPAGLKAILREWAKQHPGLMAVQSSSQALVASFGLVDVGWITLISAAEVQRAGGRHGISARLDQMCRSHVVIRELSGGAYAIRTGDIPEFGDLREGRWPQCQAAVGRALRPIWDAQANARVVLTGFDTTGDFTEQAAWANRFFEHA